MEQQAFLQRTQRVDVLNVGGSSRDAGNDSIERCLVQADQGEQIRREMCAIGWDQVGWHRHLLLAIAHGRCQLRQGIGRRLERTGSLVVS